MKLHHKVNRPIQLLAILILVTAVFHNSTHVAELLVIIVAVWIAPTLRIKRKRTRKPTTKTP